MKFYHREMENEVIIITDDSVIQYVLRGAPQRFVDPIDDFPWTPVAEGPFRDTEVTAVQALALINKSITEFIDESAKRTEELAVLAEDTWRLVSYSYDSGSYFIYYNRRNQHIFYERLDDKIIMRYIDEDDGAAEKVTASADFLKISDSAESVSYEEFRDRWNAEIDESAISLADRIDELNEGRLS